MNRLSYLSHNWLIHRINNHVLESNRQIIRGTCIDLGCGEQPYKQDILDTAQVYVGVDWPGGIHDQSGIDVLADLNLALPFADEQADTVTAFQVMEHLSEPAVFLSECFRICRAGGYILLTVPFMWRVHEAPHDYFRYTRYGLAYLLTKAGFEDVTVVENTGFWQMWLLKATYHSARWRRGFLGYVIGAVLIPVWLLSQLVAPLLDRIDQSPEETASYTVVAQKPAVLETARDGHT